MSDDIAELDAKLIKQVRGSGVGALARLVKLAREAEQRAADAQRELAHEREMLRAIAAKSEAPNAFEALVALLGAKMADIMHLERELAVSRAKELETVTCSKCGLEVTVRSLTYHTRRSHPTESGWCGRWLKDGELWELPSKAAEAAGETK